MNISFVIMTNFDSLKNKFIAPLFDKTGKIGN